MTLPVVIFGGGIALTYYIPAPYNVVAFPFAVAAAAYSGRLMPYLKDKIPLWQLVQPVVESEAQTIEAAFGLTTLLAVVLPDTFKVAAIPCALTAMTLGPMRRAIAPFSRLLVVVSVGWLLARTAF